MKREPSKSVSERTWCWFERTQIVWVRFDLDRDGNGRADFEDDLYLLGFGTEGDPAGTNAFMPSSRSRSGR